MSWPCAVGNTSTIFFSEFTFLCKAHAINHNLNDGYEHNQCPAVYGIGVDDTTPVVVCQDFKKRPSGSSIDDDGLYRIKT